jgi:hypothetical protein
MSFVENRTKRDEMQLAMLANDRSTLVKVCRENDCSTLMNVRRAERLPICGIVCTRGSLNPVGAFDSLTPNSSLLIEVGN